MATLTGYETFFYGKDILIDVIAIIILWLILRTVISYYKVDFQKNKKYFIYSFLAILVSFVFRIIGHLLIYTATPDQHIGLITLTHQSLFEATTFIFASLSLYKIFSFLGYYLLYLTYAKKELSNKKFAFMIIGISILSYFTHYAYYIFHGLILLLIIATIRVLLDKIEKKKNTHLAIVLIAFFSLAISQTMFMLIQVSTLFYVMGQVFQFLGHVLWLYKFLKVTTHGKKARTN